jgi:hypothetical protein
MDINTAVQRSRVRSVGVILGSAKDELSGRLMCDAIVIQFRIRSAILGLAYSTRCGRGEEAHTELYSADANRHICGVVTLSWSGDRIKVRHRASRGTWGSVICRCNKRWTSLSKSPNDH